MRLPLFLALAMFGSTAMADADATAGIKFDALPDAVKKTVANSLDVAAITSIVKTGDEDEYASYEIKTEKKLEGRTLPAQDLLVAGDGKVMKFVQEAPYFALSFPQMQAIEKRFPGIKVNKLDTVEVHFYNVRGEANGEKVEFRIWSDGLIEDIRDEHSASATP